MEASQKVRPDRTQVFLKHRRAVAHREESPSCWEKEERGVGTRTAVCSGDEVSDECKESGADAAAGGEMRGEPSAAEACEVSPRMDDGKFTALFVR